MKKFTLIAAALLSTTVNAEYGVFKIWHGFKHEWQRKFAGKFETPHRMGSIRNRLYNDEMAQFTFTPGVNGDYAFPKLFYSQLNDVDMP